MQIASILTDIQATVRASKFDPFGGDVLSFALNERSFGRPAAIVTLVAIEGSSPRAAGAQMAIAETGAFAGSISSGCLERAIAEKAREMMARGAGGVVRYGKGSPFRDLVLPCGSGVDLLFTINPSVDVLRAALDAQRERRPAAFQFDANAMRKSKGDKTEWRREAFVRCYAPPLKIVAAGVGAELTLLSRLAIAAGYAICAVSPDVSTLDEAAAHEKIRLQSVSSLPALDIDRWTAVVLLFHDREWDVSLLPAALASPAFYIGAVGSRKTHAARLDALRMIGVGDEDLQRIRGPIGLIPATRDPSALAVSVLADILAAWPYGQ